MTVIWRALLPKMPQQENGTLGWQFECSLQIDWETDAPLHVKPEPLPAPIPKDMLDLSDRVFTLPHLDAAKQALALYAGADRLQMPHCHVWFDLGIKLFGSCCYEEALDAFRRSIEAPHMPGFLYRNSAYLAHAWRGMMLDLLGHREEALQEYGAALANPGCCVSNMQVYSLRVDKAFIEERLKTPYERR